MQQLDFFLNVAQIVELVGGKLRFIVFNAFNQFFLVWWGV